MAKDIATDAGYKRRRFDSTLVKHMLMSLLSGNDVHNNTIVYLRHITYHKTYFRLSQLALLETTWKLPYLQATYVCKCSR